MPLRGLMFLPLLALSAGAAEPGSLAHLCAWLSGSFSSAAQAEADTSYFDIRLRMEPIWTARSDGPWLYVEQAVAEWADKPYRQRVYRVVEEEPGAYRSEVLSFADPLRFAGAWREAEPLAALSPDSLEPRRGCAVFLDWDEERQAYFGSTRERDCESTLRGASWASSIVEVRADGLVSWDRGFDEEGVQVWGAEAGGYDFRRVDPEGTDAPPDPER